MQIYVYKDNESQGPYDLGKLHELVRNGVFSEEDLACHDGQNWVQVNQVQDYHNQAIYVERKFPDSASSPQVERTSSSPPSTTKSSKKFPNRGTNKTKRYSLTFSGNGFEFFGIWIVNIVLSILTLGIYSAWAKVRTMRYFYGNTSLAGSSFAYMASPIAILKGRLIAIALLILYGVFSQLQPVISLLLGTAVFFLAPLVLVRSFRFRLQNTDYRGMRFDFAGTNSQSYGVFVGYFLLAYATCGILFPLQQVKQKEFFLGNIRFGGSQSKCSPDVGLFFRYGGICLAIIFLAAVLVVPIAFVFPPALVVVPFLFYPLMGVVGAYWHANATNHSIESTRLEDISFESRLTTGGLLGLWVTNLLLLAFTAGLAAPWVMVRNARYRLSCTSVLAKDLDSFVSRKIEYSSALGDELGEAFEIDLAI